MEGPCTCPDLYTAQSVYICVGGPHVEATPLEQHATP